MDRISEGNCSFCVFLEEKPPLWFQNRRYKEISRGSLTSAVFSGRIQGSVHCNALCSTLQIHPENTQIQA